MVAQAKIAGPLVDFVGENHGGACATELVHILPRSSFYFCVNDSVSIQGNPDQTIKLLQKHATNLRKENTDLAARVSLRPHPETKNLTPR